MSSCGPSISDGSYVAWFLVLRSSCFGNRRVGVIVGCGIDVLSFCSPSWVASKYCSEWSSCDVATST